MLLLALDMLTSGSVSAGEQMVPFRYTHTLPPTHPVNTSHKRVDLIFVLLTTAQSAIPKRCIHLHKVHLVLSGKEASENLAEITG